MSLRNITKIFFFGSLLILSGCQKNIFQSPSVAPVAMRDVPALRLNYRYEADVPAPPESAKNAPVEDRSAAVQTDYDQNRTQELLDKTIASPDKQKVVAVYHRTGDVQAEFRLDMYTADGVFLRKITPDAMAVHFPDTIVWSPDSTTLAFVAMTRAGEQGNGLPPVTQPNQNTNSNSANTNSPANSNTPVSNTATNANSETSTMDAEANANSGIPAAPTPAAPTGILTFRTEQIYTCNSDGAGIKPVTQNEGLIYFYYGWSPDSAMLASLAATYKEWQFLQYQADSKGEMFIPWADRGSSKKPDASAVWTML